MVGKTNLFLQKKPINLLNVRLDIIWLRLAPVLVHTGRAERARARSVESRDAKGGLKQRIHYFISDHHNGAKFKTKHLDIIPDEKNY